MSLLQRASYKAWFLIAAGLAPVRVFAQNSFAGPIPEIGGTPSANSEGDFRAAVLSVLYFVLSFLALLAVIFIVIAGIRLIISQGEDEGKEKAKKTIFAVILGLLVILFARFIVGFFTQTVPATFN